MKHEADTQNENKHQVLELVTLGEVARRHGICAGTLRRAIERNGIRPDAVTIGGSKMKRSPLFVEPRLPELAELVKTQTR
jgi:transposase-like protein